MRILVISDIHANLSALEAVIASTGDIDATWCLGDLVGYGPDPNDCIERVRELANLSCVMGNHDAAALKQLDPDSFNPEARQALIWTQQTLNADSVTFLSNLPERLVMDSESVRTGSQVTLAHGSPRHPVWEYLLDTRNASRNFDFFETPYCFVGHTHLPVLYHKNDDHDSAQLLIPEANHLLELRPRAILNPGSVGQPRDRNPRASYAIYDPDTATWDYRRVEYDISGVQKRMKAANLPDRHIQRLTAGW